MASVLECHDCGLLLRMRALPDGGRARCRRCGAVLYRHRSDSVGRPLALAIAALIAFVIANSFSFMSFELEGREQNSILISGVIELFRGGLWELGTVVFLLAIAIPFAKLAATLYVLVPLQFGSRPRHGPAVFRLVAALRPWGMTEVYLLGVLVAYVKLVDMATIEIGISLYAFAALIILMVWLEASLEPHDIWQRLSPAPPVAAPAVTGTARWTACHSCHLVIPVAAAASAIAGDASPGACPRCGAHLHKRKPNSMGRTTALVITAAILYIPANVFPVMTVISFGSGEPDTILSGVMALLAAGMWPLALLVFFASIIVPMLKLIGLSWLLWSVRRQCKSRLRDRTRLYRIIEQVGRWSMIDIFMLAILVSLVQLGSIATIEPGVGAISFAAVVVLTMIAAMTFDPRLIWDAGEAKHDR